MEKCGAVSESRYPGEQLHHEVLQVAFAACNAPDSLLSAAVLQRHRQRIRSQCAAGAVSLEGLYAQLCVFFATSPTAEPDDLRAVLGDLLDVADVCDGLWERFTRPGDLMRRDPHGLILRTCPVSEDRAVALLERVATCDDLGQYSPESAAYYPLLSAVPEHDPRVSDAVAQAAKRPHAEGLVSAYRLFRVAADRIRSELQSYRYAV